MSAGSVKARRLTLIPAERWGLRLSVHVFKWGVHWKLRRRTDCWHHLLFKGSRGSAFGGRRRRQLLVMTWTARKGVRGPIGGGWRFIVAVDSLRGLDPSESMRVPGFPNRPRFVKEEQ